MSTTSVRLLDRVRDASDQAAWERFVSLYSPLILRWCRNAGVSMQEAPDLAQDVFALLVQKLPQFEYRPERGGFRAWLKTIVMRQAAARHARTDRQGRLRSLDDHEPPAIQDARFEEEEHKALLIRHAFELMRRDFDDRTWQACWDHLVSGDTAADVGRRLGMSEGAVYVAKSRVLRRLREEFQGLLE